MEESKNITIVIPTYNPDKKIMKKIENAISNQDFEWKIKIIKVSGMGLAEGMNYGIKQAKTEIVITLHQDCIPSSKDWLKKLIKPLEDNNTVCTVSKVELPKLFWKNFGFFARIFSAKEQKIITPLMDEKGCAYKKSALEKIGGFNSKTFRTAGEDFDMFLKLKKVGKIKYPQTKVFHFHKHTFNNRLKKELQISEGFGCLVRIYGKEMTGWYIGILKSLPFIGWPLFWIKFPYRKMFFGGILWIFPLSLMINILYSIGFWKGFLSGKQRI